MKKLILFIVITLTTTVTYAQEKSDKALKNYKGYFNFSYDESQDKILLDVKDLDKEFLYVSSLSRGIGDVYKRQCLYYRFDNFFNARHPWCG